MLDVQIQVSKVQDSLQFTQPQTQSCSQSAPSKASNKPDVAGSGNTKIDDMLTTHDWISPWVLQQLIKKKSESQLIDLLVAGDNVALLWIKTMRLWYISYVNQRHESSSDRPGIFLAVRGFRTPWIIKILAAHMSAFNKLMLNDFRQVRDWWDRQDLLCQGFDLEDKIRLWTFA